MVHHFLALGVAIGPMLYLMPTARDRHIAGLRALAKKWAIPSS